MANSLAVFFEEEFSISSISPLLLLSYLVFAAATTQIVRLAGPVSITSYRLEETYDTGSGLTNVVYRIVAPVVWIFILLLVFTAIAGVLHIDMTFCTRWMPVAFYWIFIFLIKLFQKGRASLGTATIIESLLSIGTTIYFDWAVVRQIPSLGLLAVDQSNIGFQLAIALFFSLSQCAASLIVRKNYQEALSRASFGKSCRNLKTTVKTPSEKRLYKYQNEFGELLPKRFKDDILLRSVFYSIMYIEDVNRPKPIRILERFLHRLGLAKTTGIMQQRGNHPLTDEESVELAIPYIEKMWDSFLSCFARNHPSSESSFRFTEKWYSYEYLTVSTQLQQTFASLYGDYSGTRILNANPVLESVIAFEQRESYEMVSSWVYAKGALFPEEAAWFDDEVLRWENQSTLAPSSEIDITNCFIEHLESPEKSDIRNAVYSIRADHGKILRVDAEPSFFCKIWFTRNEQLKLEQPGSQKR